MCLTKTKRLPRIATKDITVYKVITEVNGKLETTCMRYPVEIGETYTGDFKESYKWSDCIFSYPLYKIYKYICSIFSRIIYGGYIHSYRCYSLARLEAKGRSTLYAQYVVECIIPKGSIYFIGERGFQYASSKLRYSTIVSCYFEREYSL